MIERLGNYGRREDIVDRHIIEVNEGSTSSNDSLVSGDELNSEEEALRRNAIQTLDLRKRLSGGSVSTLKRVVEQEVPIEPDAAAAVSAAMVEEYDPENPAPTSAPTKAKKDKKKSKKEKKLMKKVKEGTASKKDLKKLKKKLQKKIEATVTSAAVTAGATSEPVRDDRYSDDEDDKGPSLADRIANRGQTMISDQKTRTFDFANNSNPKNRLGEKGEKRTIMIKSDDSDDSLPKEKIVKTKVVRAKMANKSKHKKDVKVAESGVDGHKSDKRTREPSIKTDDVKNMIADVDSLLSKSDVEALLSPTSSKTDKPPAAETSMQAVDELEALLK